MGCEDLRVLPGVPLAHVDEPGGGELRLEQLAGVDLAVPVEVVGLLAEVSEQRRGRVPAEGVAVYSVAHHEPQVGHGDP